MQLQIFWAASSTDWLNFILSVDSVQSLWLFMRISSGVRLSISIDILIMDDERAEFFLVLFLSKCVQVMSSR